MYGTKTSSDPGPGVDDGDDDDNAGAGSGKPTSTLKPPVSTQQPATPEGDPELCNDGKIDAIFNSAEGVTYLFKGNFHLFTNHSRFEESARIFSIPEISDGSGR